MAELYVFSPGDDDERARRRAERAAARARVRARYAALLVDRVGLDEVAADLVMATLFDHTDEHGEPCLLSHHPTLPDDGEHSHDAGFDCPCTWDENRRDQERLARRARLDEWFNSPAAESMRIAGDLDRVAVQVWIEGHPGVDAERTGVAYPEVWEGVIDGHSFYFRERDDNWRIELDLRANGHYANRVVGTSEDGELITEPVELTSGEVIAEGAASALGDGPVEHLAFIVDTVRTHLARAICSHERAERYCPSCGARAARPHGKQFPGTT